MKSRLLLIDGNAIMHRAYHALPPMNNSQGQPTNAIYGFISMLLGTITQLKPTHIAVAFDRPSPTFRKKLYTEYQSHRPRMEDTLSSQIELIHKVLMAMQIPIFEKDGYEADDVLGTLARQIVPNKITEAIIVTGDRDLLQLVNNHVALYMPVKGLSESKLYREKEATERMGVEPAKVVELKGLMGDPSDNYPGVAGIGPKTAISLLEQFGNIPKLYDHLDEVKNQRVLEKLRANRDNAFLSRELATVKTDVPLEFNLSEAKYRDLATEAVIKLFGELEFKTLLKRLLSLSKTEETAVIKTKAEKKDQLGLF